MKRVNNSKQQGFTIVELLIATTVFSIILLAAAATLIQVGRMYYKGVISSRTQDVARTVIDDVSRTLQFSNGAKGEATTGNDPQIRAICLGNTRYTYVLGFQVSNNPDQPNQIRHALWQDKIGAGTEACDTDLPNLTLEDPYAYDGVGNSDREGRELLSPNMRLQDFSVTNQSGSDDVFNIRVKVVYGNDDLLNDPENPTSCKGSVVGGQWCAISDLSSVVYSRSK